MNIDATYRFEAPPPRVWDALMDTEIIAACLPGCRGLRPAGPDRFETELVAGVAAVSGNFKATMTLKDPRPPDSYRLLVDAAGRPGFVRGEAQVTLAADAGGTSVTIAAHADVGGTMARVGQRLLEGVARMTMDRFYGCLARRVAGE
jgi:carbon monoxide dehydrogenase subunit G